MQNRYARIAMNKLGAQNVQHIATIIRVRIEPGHMMLMIRYGTLEFQFDVGDACFNEINA